MDDLFGDEDINKFANMQIYKQILGDKKDQPIYQLLLRKIMSEGDNPLGSTNTLGSDSSFKSPFSDSNALGNMRIPRLLR